MDKPDVDFIEGLSPAVSIDQKSTNRNPRSTVGTITEVYDYLRLLFARAGRPHCPICGEAITRQSPQQIVDRLLELPDRTRFQVLAPVVKGRKGEYVDLFAELQTKGFSRARVDGEVVSLTEPPQLEKKLKHTIEVVVDRLVAKGGDAGSKRRLTDSVETALNLAGGVLLIEFVDVDPDDPDAVRERRFSEKMACPNDHPIAIDEIEPRSFSFNAPYGACPRCTGIGTELEVDPELLVPDDDLSLGRRCHRPVVAGLRLGRLLPARHRRARRGPQLLDGHAVEGPARAGQGGAALRRELQGPRQVPQPLRPRPVLHDRVRGGRPVRQAAARRDRLRLEPGALRGLHAGGALPPVQGRPPEAGDPRRPHRRQEHLRDLRAGHQRGRRRSSPTSTSRCASGRSPSGSSRRSRRGWASCSTSASTTCRWTGRPARCPAARRSASGWRRRSGPAWSACSTSSTSPRSACTSATTTGSSRR